jgi:hypothetical protein
MKSKYIIFKGEQNISDFIRDLFNLLKDRGASSRQQEACLIFFCKTTNESAPFKGGSTINTQ